MYIDLHAEIQPFCRSGANPFRPREIATRLRETTLGLQRRHTASLPDLPADEHADLADTLRRALRVLETVYRPEGFNLGMNLGTCAGAGFADHLHWHIVPRWTGDTNFMPMLADTRVMPQHLHDTWERLRGAFAPRA